MKMLEGYDLVDLSIGTTHPEAFFRKHELLSEDYYDMSPGFLQVHCDLGVFGMMRNPKNEPEIIIRLMRLMPCKRDYFCLE